MMINFNRDQVIAAAPDSDSVKKAEKLAKPDKWKIVAENEQALWGEIQGSGLYQVAIDLEQLAFKCSCPSYKKPCKHGLALALLKAHAYEITKTTPPEWVTTWLNKRHQKIKTKEEQVVDPEAQAKRDKAAQKRLDARIEKINQGIEDLSQWLKDIIRQGLANQVQQGYSFWDTMGARLVDAQAPSLARRVRNLASIPSMGDQWQAKLLAELAKIHLIIKAYQKLDQLSLEQQEDIKSLIGFSNKKEDILEKNGIKDKWWILGRYYQETEDNMTTQRTWLLGENSQRSALLMDYFRYNNDFSNNNSLLVPGLCIQAEITFYPGTTSQLALIKGHWETIDNISHALPFGHQDFEQAFAAYTDILQLNPWAERQVFALKNIIPIYDQGFWFLRDNKGRELPIIKSFSEGWKLLAASLGHPIDIFGEWDGDAFLPLSSFSKAGFSLYKHELNI